MKFLSIHGLKWLFSQLFDKCFLLRCVSVLILSFFSPNVDILFFLSNFVTSLLNSDPLSHWNTLYLDATSTSVNMKMHSVRSSWPWSLVLVNLQWGCLIYLVGVINLPKYLFYKLWLNIFFLYRRDFIRHSNCLVTCPKVIMSLPTVTNNILSFFWPSDGK